MLKKIIFVVFAGLFFSQVADAANVEFLAEKAVFRAGEKAVVEVYIKSQEGPVNTVSGQVVFDPAFFEKVEVSDGGTVVGAWVEKPEVAAGKVKFSGLILGGAGEGRLFYLELWPKADGESSLFLEDGQVFYNDGSGAPARVASSRFEIKVLKADGLEKDLMISEPEDTVPPNDFDIRVARDPQIFENRWFAVFNATDGQSGISSYEAAETDGDVPDEPEWQKAESPYILKDQKRQSHLFVRAVDRSGNQKISVLPPLAVNENIWKNWLFYVIISIVVFGILAAWKKQNVQKQN